MWDDIFGTNKDWLCEFARRYPKEIGLPFSVHLAPSTTDEYTVKKLAEAGCIGIGIGMQTGSARVHREYYHRGYNRDQVLHVASFLHPAIPTFHDLIINNPYETENDVRQTLELYCDMPRPFGIATNTLLWHPNCSLTQRAQREGIISEDDIVGRRTDGEYLFRDSTFCPPAPTRESRRLYSLNMLVVATQHPCMDQEELRNMGYDDDLLDHPEELERRLALAYLAESEKDLLRAEDKIVQMEARMAGLERDLRQLQKNVSSIDA